MVGLEAPTIGPVDPSSGAEAPEVPETPAGTSTILIHSNFSPVAKSAST